ncbi:MAG TPA: nuclear transport factor 2 family protein [Alphaproteobacteria bacterium]|nr:nuclear transport factor 2 family protein [Alphaproteobacteria bacterium]
MLKLLGQNISLFFVFIALAMAPSFAVGAPLEKRIPLNYKDRSEITDLFYEYSYYIDNRAGEAFASTFTPEGKLDFPGVVVQGHDQLVAFGSRPVEDKIRFHFVGDILLVQVTRGHVRARSMVIVGLRDSHGKSPTTFEGCGIYEDDIVKTPVGWRFAHRHADATIPISREFLLPNTPGG